MPGLYANGLPIPATPALHGLVSVSTEVTTPDRWELGYTIFPENCVEVGTWDPDCEAWPDGEKPQKSTTTNLDGYDVDPFVIETEFHCDAQGFSVVDFAGRARRQLEAGTPKALEYELWTGTLKPGNPNLATGATVIGGGAAFPVNIGLSLLGQALANCAHGGVGVIHAPPWIVESWIADYRVKENGNRLQTIVRGDLIAAGAGYPGTGPGGIMPGNLESWAYATGPLQHRLGEPQLFPQTLPEALDKKHNDIEYRAERHAAVNFDPCCHFAILLTADPNGDLASV